MSVESADSRSHTPGVPAYDAMRRRLLSGTLSGLAAAALGTSAARAADTTATPATKLLILIWRKPGLSRQAFIDYYETHHAPLARRLVPQIAAANYRRNYVEASVPYVPGVRFFDFDVITEIAFASRADYDGAMQTLARPEVSELIVRDEASFIDRSKIQSFMIQTHSSPPASAQR